ncbi:DUF3127 domain-containing protein [Cruoricaptor ignavus]|uniref:DUF3127 domain-containing protein n=1 Tax=Cruoricaptor ignavus TaxID=1118202 RepID=UPI00370D65AC
MEITGFMLNRSEEKRISDTFQTMDFYVDCSEFDRRTGQKYENILKFQLSNSNIDRLDSIKKGDMIKITFRPQGRTYQKDGEKRHFQTLSAWNVELLEKQVKGENVQNTAHAQPEEDEDDGLPF